MNENAANEPFPAEVPAGFERRWFRAGERLLAIDRASDPATPAAGGSDAAGAEAGALARADADSIERFRDALLLDDHGSLLDAAADWLGEECDWRPGEGTTDAFDVTLREIGGDRRIGLAFERAPLADTLGGLPFRWRDRVSLLRHRLAAELVLDRFALAAEDVAHWAAGSVVILPNSFRVGWQAVLAEPPEPSADSAMDSGADSAGNVAPDADAPGSGDEPERTAEAESAAARGEAAAAFGEAVLAERFTVDAVRLGLDPLETLAPAAARVLESLDGRRGRMRLRTNGETRFSTARGTFARFGAGLAFVIDEGRDAGRADAS